MQNDSSKDTENERHTERFDKQRMLIEKPLISFDTSYHLQRFWLSMMTTTIKKSPDHAQPDVRPALPKTRLRNQVRYIRMEPAASKQISTFGKSNDPLVPCICLASNDKGHVYLLQIHVEQRRILLDRRQLLEEVWLRHEGARAGVAVQFHERFGGREEPRHAALPLSSLLLFSRILQAYRK